MLMPEEAAALAINVRASWFPPAISVLSHFQHPTIATYPTMARKKIIIDTDPVGKFPL
jgi:hypothetical protein